VEYLDRSRCMVQTKSSGGSCSDFTIWGRSFVLVQESLINLTTRSKPKTQWQNEHAADSGFHVLDALTDCPCFCFCFFEGRPTVQVKRSNSSLSCRLLVEYKYICGHGPKRKISWPGSVVIRSTQMNPKISKPKTGKAPGPFSTSGTWVGLFPEVESGVWTKG
jgi:hypothetical protein